MSDDPLGPDELYHAADADGDSLLLTKMWGSSNQLRFTNASAANLDSQQLADVRLPEPAVCSIAFQSRITSGSGLVSVLNLELILGLGRTVMTEVVTFGAQPSAGAPLNFLRPSQPLSSLQVRVFGFGSSDNPDDLILTNTIQVGPFTRINYKSDPLTFGMAQPGEADGLDDALRDDLEGESPTVQQIMQGEAGENAFPEDQEEPARIVRPSAHRDTLIRTVIARLEQRYRRRPSKQEVRVALNLIDARMQRRTQRRQQHR
jgi:hypothetical protein